MNLALTMVTMLFAEQQFDLADMASAAVRWTLRVLLFLLQCIMSPAVLYQSLKTRGRCPPITNKLLLMSATELAKRIRKGELSSEKLVMAYIERCREVNPLLNAIVDTRYEIAIQEAKEADEVIRSGIKKEDEIARETPLLGIPVTVKESIAVQGMSNAAGLKQAKPRIALRDADVVQSIRAAGGIVLLVSNTPELCMCWETFNKVTGTTVNPYDTRRTSGGSSGGEGALLGAGASLLSISSDIGGSARLPAMFCGVFGHKATPWTVSVNGHNPDCYDKKWPDHFSIGPMVRYAEDLPIMLKTMSQPNGPELQLDKKVPLKEMKYFYMEDCGSEAMSPVDSEILSGMRRVVDFLKSHQGLAVQKAELEDIKYLFELTAAILLQLPAESIYMKGTDPREWKSVFREHLKFLCLMSPYTFPNIAYGVLKKVNDKLPQSYLDRMEVKRLALRKQFAELLGDNGVLIFPTFGSPAHYHYEIFPKVTNISYMGIFNAIGLPVTQCPIGLNRNGLPIGFQIIANPGCDHLTISLAQEIEKAFGGWQPPTPSDKILSS